MYSFSQNYYTGDIATVLGFARTASAKLLALVKGSTTLGDSKLDNLKEKFKGKEICRLLIYMYSNVHF